MYLSVCDGGKLLSGMGECISRILTFFVYCLQASQSGYTVDYVTQGAQGGFPGSFLNQNSQAGYSHFGSGNDFMSQVGFTLRLQLSSLSVLYSLLLHYLS